MSVGQFVDKNDKNLVSKNPLHDKLVLTKIGSIYYPAKKMCQSLFFNKVASLGN